jgi:hypothetical protein
MAKAKNESEVTVSIFDEMPEVSGETVLNNEPRRIQHNNNERRFQLPLEFWGGSDLEFTNPIENVAHEGNGAIVPSFLLDQITILYISHRLYWQTGEGAEYQISNEYQGEGWKSRLQIFCLLKEAEDFIPCVLTVGSLTAKATEQAIRTGQLRIKTMLRRIGYGDREERLFWMTLVIPGTPTSASNGDGKQKNIYPPTVLAPEVYKMSKKNIADYLVEIYAGQDIKDVFSDGLRAEGEQWALSASSRLQLVSGPLPPVSVKAVVLVDGSLHLPDLSNATQKQMIECGMSIPGIFNHERHAGRAFGKVIKSGSSKAVQWDAWKAQLLKYWEGLQVFNDSQQRAAEDRGLMPQSTAEMSAMDEVEAHAAEEDEIPAA